MNAAAAAVELHHAIDQGEQREVAPLADILAGVELGADLADQNAAGETASPPKRLTPRRWALESRPFRLEPCPFLCAMESPTSPLGGPGRLCLCAVESYVATPPLAANQRPVTHHFYR